MTATRFKAESTSSSEAAADQPCEGGPNGRVTRCPRGSAQTFPPLAAIKRHEDGWCRRDGRSAATRGQTRADKTARGAQSFATGLYQFLHGSEDDETRFSRWCAIVSELPRRQTRVLTWPLVTIWGFIAQPDRHLFLKPNVTKIAARKYGFEF